jgi:hypothetical protein
MIIEIRTYRLKPGAAQEFLRIMHEEAFPLLEKFGLRVLAGGLTLAEGEDAYLIRAFTSLEERAKQEAEFYGSDEWKAGPREGVISHIESYHDVVLEGDQLGADIVRFVGA